MAKLVYFEWKKLWHNGTLWLFFALLLLGNLFAVYMTEKSSAAFYYIFLHRDAYEAYLADGTDEEGFYTQEDETLETYLEGYPEFLVTMREQAETKKKMTAYADENSFVYRNLDKTCADFEALSDISVTKDNCYGIKRYAAYTFGIFFALIFLAVTAFYVFYRERNRGILLLLKGTKRGHAPLIGAKLLAFLGFAGVYTLLQELSTLLLYGFFYGFGDMGRSIQSVSLFRNCAYALSVGGAFACTLAVRVCIILIAAVFLFLCSVAVRNEFAALFTGAAALAAEYLLCRSLGMSGSLNGLKCVNVFFCWDMEQFLGTYQNLNLFRYPVGKDVCSAAAGIFFCAAAAAAGTAVFHRTYQIRREGVFAKIGYFFRKKTAFFWRHVGLTRFELSKTFFQQKKGLVLAFLLALCVTELVQGGTTQYFDSFREAYYHSYLQQIHGKVTDESLDFVAEKQAYIEELSEEIAALAASDSAADYVLLQEKQLRYEAEAEAVDMLVAQLEMLKANGNLYEKYWVDETSYQNLWSNTGSEILLGALGLIGTILWLSGIYPSEEKKKLVPLLSSMKNGRKPLQRRKNLTAFFGALAAFGMTQAPILVNYWRVDGFTTLNQRLSDITSSSFSDTLTIGSLLALVFVLKAALFAALAWLGVWVSRRVKNEMAVNLFGVALVLIPALILSYFQMDITQWILYAQVTYL